MVDRPLLERELAVARRHVAQGGERLAQQRGIVDDLEAEGHDATMARLLLRTFEDTQQLHMADMARIEGELEKLR